MLLIFAVTPVEFNEKIGGRTIDHEKELDLNAIYSLNVINLQITVYVSLCVLAQEKWDHQSNKKSCSTHFCLYPLLDMSPTDFPSLVCIKLSQADQQLYDLCHHLLAVQDLLNESTNLQNVLPRDIHQRFILLTFQYCRRALRTVLL